MILINYMSIDGYYLGAYDEGQCPVEGATICGSMPLDTRAKWINGEWSYDEPLAYDVRAQRNDLLTLRVDPLVCNPLRWADLTSDQQAEWTLYRRALLDITAQSGFPTNITWPTKPE